MPRSGPRRTLIGFKALPSAREALDKRVAEEERIEGRPLGRSEVLRRLCAFGLVHMPRGWKP